MRIFLLMGNLQGNDVTLDKEDIHVSQLRDLKTRIIEFIDILVIMGKCHDVIENELNRK